MSELMSVDAALERVLEHFHRLETETIPLDQSLDRVLGADVHAEHNVPPFPNSGMDGYAVRAEDVAAASPDRPTRLRVAFDIPAGSAPTLPLHPGQAARIMTGAPIPQGADAVVPVENTDSTWRGDSTDILPSEVLIYRSVKAGDSIRQAGEDIRAGQVVLRAGTVLRAAEIGVLASIGSSQVVVVRRPRAVIVSTGDELAGLDETLMPGKIRDSNSHVLAALVTTYGGAAIRIPVARDTLDDVRRRFREALEQRPDVIISSAGVSVGAFDVVRAVLSELGEVNFWRINLRPGKPLAFGQLQGVPFFGLPGNPVSAMVTFEIFVRPALLKLGGQPDVVETVSAVVGEDIRSDGRRSYLRVTLAQENGHLTARTTGIQSSAALTSMVLADGLLIVPENVTLVASGEVLPVRLLRPLVRH